MKSYGFVSRKLLNQLTDVWNADDIGADKTRCGLKGSPTKVVKSFENKSGKRKCKFISAEELSRAINEGLNKEPEAIAASSSSEKLKNVKFQSRSLVESWPILMNQKNIILLVMQFAPAQMELFLR